MLGSRHYGLIFDQQRNGHQKRQATSSLKGRSKQPPRGSCIAADRRRQDSGVEHQFHSQLYDIACNIANRRVLSNVSCTVGSLVAERALALLRRVHPIGFVLRIVGRATKQAYCALYYFRPVRSRTPGPPPFSSMNST